MGARVTSLGSTGEGGEVITGRGVVVTGRGVTEGAEVKGGRVG